MFTPLALALVAQSQCFDCDIPARVDVVVTYTAAAAVEIPDIEQWIADQVAQVPNVQLVFANGLHYLEADDDPCNLYGLTQWLAEPDDGILDMATDWREQHAGDILVFIGYYPDSGCHSSLVGFAGYDCDADNDPFNYNKRAGQIIFNAKYWDYDFVPLWDRIEYVADSSPWKAANRFCSVACPEDFNMDTWVTTADLLAAIAWGDTADILECLGAWGACYE